MPAPPGRSWLPCVEREARLVPCDGCQRGGSWRARGAARAAVVDVGARGRGGRRARLRARRHRGRPPGARRLRPVRRLLQRVQLRGLPRGHRVTRSDRAAGGRVSGRRDERDHHVRHPRRRRARRFDRSDWRRRRHDRDPRRRRPRAAGDRPGPATGDGVRGRGERPSCRAPASRAGRADTARGVRRRPGRRRRPLRRRARARRARIHGDRHRAIAGRPRVPSRSAAGHDLPTRQRDVLVPGRALGALRWRRRELRRRRARPGCANRRHRGPRGRGARDRRHGQRECGAAVEGDLRRHLADDRCASRGAERIRACRRDRRRRRVRNRGVTPGRCRGLRVAQCCRARRGAERCYRGRSAMGSPRRGRCNRIRSRHGVRAFRPDASRCRAGTRSSHEASTSTHSCSAPARW